MFFYSMNKFLTTIKDIKSVANKVFTTFAFTNQLNTITTMAGFKNPITILEAIRQIQANNYLLPAFQREFTWSHTQIERLFDSLMSGYPINSMMFWRVTGEASHKYRFYRILENYRERHMIHNTAFDTSIKESFFAIIDGQQRLTSLYIGLCGSYAYHRHYAHYDDTEWNFPTRHLYLNLSRTIKDEDDDRTYDFAFIDKAVTTDMLYEDREGCKWLRVGHVLTFGEQYDDHDFAEEHNLCRDERKVLSRLYSAITRTEPINYYEEDTANPDDAVNIFVRINSGGTRLSFADILLSITVAAWQKDAREEIRGLVDEVNKMGFNISHDYVLKAFLYLFHQDVKFKIGSFDNEFVRTVEGQWTEIRAAMSFLFRLLGVFGLNGSTLTSNYATLPLLLYLYRRGIYREVVTKAVHAEDRNIMKRWLLKTLLLRTFGYRSDWVLRISRRVVNGGEWLAFPATELEAELGQRITDTQFYETVLTNSYDNRLTWVVLSLLYQNLTFEGFMYDIDHLHPKSTCQELGIDRAMYDSVLNLQLLPREANNEKRAIPLEEWVEKASVGIERHEFLRTHLIPDVSLDIENFNTFIEARKQMLVERLKIIL